LTGAQWDRGASLPVDIWAATAKPHGGRNTEAGHRAPSWTGMSHWRAPCRVLRGRAGVVHVGRRCHAGDWQAVPVAHDVILAPFLALSVGLGRSGRRRAWRAPSNCPRSGRGPGQAGCAACRPAWNARAAARPSAPSPPSGAARWTRSLGRPSPAGCATACPRAGTAARWPAPAPSRSEGGRGRRRVSARTTRSPVQSAPRRSRSTLLSSSWSSRCEHRPP